MMLSLCHCWWHNLRTEQSPSLKQIYHQIGLWLPLLRWITTNHRKELGTSTDSTFWVNICWKRMRSVSPIHSSACKPRFHLDTWMTILKKCNPYWKTYGIYIYRFMYIYTYIISWWKTSWCSVTYHFCPLPSILWLTEAVDETWHGSLSWNPSNNPLDFGDVPASILYKCSGEKQISKSITWARSKSWNSWPKEDVGKENQCSCLMNNDTCHVYR